MAETASMCVVWLRSKACTYISVLVQTKCTLLRELSPFLSLGFTLQPLGSFQVKPHPKTHSQSPPNALAPQPLTAVAPIRAGLRETSAKCVLASRGPCPMSPLLLSCTGIHGSCSSTDSSHLCSTIWSRCIQAHHEAIPQGDKLPPLRLIRQSSGCDCFSCECLNLINPSEFCCCLISGNNCN